MSRGMLCCRVIPTLLYRGAGLVKGVGFDSWRGIGGAAQAMKVYFMREVDQMVLLDLNEGPPNIELIAGLSRHCAFLPLAVGGGVSALEHVDDLLAVGADMVVVNTAAIDRPDFVTEVSSKYGSQAIVVSIDAKRGTVWVDSGARDTGLDPVETARRAEGNGAGEILITAIERDGTMGGYDLELISRVAGAVACPVTASGGAGSYEDMNAALGAGASAVAAASMFHFTDQTPRGAKEYLQDRGHEVRL